MKQPLNAAASPSDKGGASRVLTSPTRGALAITATAQKPPRSLFGDAVLIAGIGGTAPGPSRSGDHRQGRLSAIGFTLFEIAGRHGHLIRHMGEAQNRLAARPGKGVERRCFHLDREDVASSAPFDLGGGLAKWRVGCPRGAAVDGFRKR